MNIGFFSFYGDICCVFFVFGFVVYVGDVGEFYVFEFFFFEFVFGDGID